MPTVISNENELRQALSAPVQEAVNFMMDELRKENENKIWTTVYSGYSPSWYDRTADFWDSWDYEEDGSLGDLGGADFDFHPETLSVGTQENGQHASIVDGSPFTYFLADVIYQGYDMPRNGVHIPARNAFKKIDRWFSERQIKILFRKGLRKAGLKVAQDGGATKTVI